MEKENIKKEDIINILYLERSDEIERENYDDEYQTLERDKNRTQDALLNFLRESLRDDKFEIAKEYIEKIEEKVNSLYVHKTKRFYGAGFCDGIKMN